MYAAPHRVLLRSASCKASVRPCQIRLAGSNPNVSDEVLVRLALKHGAYHFVLDAVLDFGLAYVWQQWLLMLEDEDAAPPMLAGVDVERKLANIERGLRSVGL